jgi:hypothetical protein
MRFLILAGVLVLTGCVTANTDLSVQSLPEGLEVELQGYRLFLRDVYQLEVRVRNAGDGVLYRLNDHDVLIITGREITVDGQTLDIIPGERFEITQASVSDPATKSPVPSPEKQLPGRSP